MATVESVLAEDCWVVDRRKLGLERNAVVDMIADVVLVLLGRTGNPKFLVKTQEQVVHLFSTVGCFFVGNRCESAEWNFASYRRSNGGKEQRMRIPLGLE